MLVSQLNSEDLQYDPMTTTKNESHQHQNASTSFPLSQSPQRSLFTNSEAYDLSPFSHGSLKPQTSSANSSSRNAFQVPQQQQNDIGNNIPADTHQKALDYFSPGKFTI